jgi:hypothetical protein
MAEIKGKLRYLQVHLRYPRNTVAELNSGTCLASGRQRKIELCTGIC